MPRVFERVYAKVQELLAEQPALVRKVFMDANKDGKLTVVEIQKSYPSLDSDVIDNTDVNADTVITIYEFRYILYKDFDVMDKNRDGSLDQEEIKSAMEEE